MRFSRNWIAEYVELPDGADELARRLTAAGLAVDDVEEVELGDGSTDSILEIDITTNRPDAMNHLGLAREAAVLFGEELRPPRVEPARAAERADEAARLVVEDSKLCPRYVALALRGVTVGPSPPWLVARLQAIGQRSINNIVDVTNFVLWETGQPLHAFDLDELGPEVRVRRARAGERLVTLDGEERELDEEILAITDAEKPVALAGIMGGLLSEVTDKTTNVLLESAHFDPKTVRRGGKKLGLHTDARHRFERGADPEACLWAAERAAALMVEVAGGELLDGALDAKELRADWPPRVEVSLAKANAFGGSEIDAAEAEATLSGLGFELETTGAATWSVTVPPWRYYDFEDPYPADVYEELLRIHGFDNVPSTLPRISGADLPERADHRQRRKAQDVLVASGFAEAINFAFHDRESDAAYPTLYEGRETLAIGNPLSDRYAVMRRSLLPNLVGSVYYNARRGAPAVRLFEIGHVFRRDGEGSDEQEAVALALGGRLGTPWERPVELDFYDLKGVLEDLAHELGTRFELGPATRRKLVPGTAAEIRIVARGGEGRAIGHVGQLDDEDLPFPLFVAEIETAAILAGGVDLTARLPSRYPSIAVDSTLTHSLAVPWSEMEQAIADFGAPDLVDYGLKDRYRGQGVPQGSVATTLYFLYNSEERSLTQEEVNERHQRLAGELERRFASTGA